MEKIDLVYVLGTGSQWNDNEIRFSLRSIHQNLDNVGEVYVIGEKPNFLQGIKHIACPDQFENNADGNIILKIIRASEIPELTDDFLFMNDDHIILTKQDATKIKPYYRIDLSELEPSYFKANNWRERLGRTYEFLKANNYPTRHHDCHTPMIMNKKKVIEVFADIPFQIGNGYTVKSLYSNILFPEALILGNKKKTVFAPYSYDQISERFMDCQFLAFNDQGLNQALKLWLYERFPEPSPWETSDIEDRHIDIYRALYPQFNYELARQVFLKYDKSKNIKELVRNDTAQAMAKKIQFKLKFKLDESAIPNT